MARACATTRSHASIAAARSTYDCVGVSTGPSTTGVETAAFAAACSGEAGSSNGAVVDESAGSPEGVVVAVFLVVVLVAVVVIEAGKRRANAGAAVERSMMPRWIRIEGNTLSANTGKCDVCGTGKGERSLMPKRTLTAFIRKSAFLKQKMATRGKAVGRQST